MSSVRHVRVLALAVCAFACAGAAKGERTDAKSSGTKPAATPTPPKKFPVVVKSDAAATVEAHFQGEAPPADLGVALVFGTTRLFFTFKNDKTALVFTPKGELHFSDWTFDIFSPDGKWVVLLQDRFGPYHVVSTAKLRDYLVGKAEPDKVVTVPRNPGESALVHSAAHWVSATELEYVVAGETPEKKRATVP